MITDHQVEEACRTFWSTQNAAVDAQRGPDDERLNRYEWGAEHLPASVWDSYRVAMRAALEAAERAAWQPIETRPQDHKPCWIGHAPSSTILVAWPHYRGGWCIMWSSGHMVPWTPTHWRPCPELRA